MKKTLSVVCVLLWSLASLWSQNFAAQSDVQWVAVPDHADWLYKVGQNATIDVQLLCHGMPVADGVRIGFKLSPDCLPTESEGVAEVKDGHARIAVGTMWQPGFKDCRMECTLEGRTYRNHLKVGFDPQRLTPLTRQPDDFDAYWQQVLAEQQATPLSPEVTPAPEFSDDRVECFLVKLHGGSRAEPHAIYGYLTVPRRGTGRYPVVISPPGAGVKHMEPTKTQFYASEGQMIRFELEIHGISPALSAADYRDVSRAFGDHTPGGYLANGIQSRDTYYMRHVYAMLVRAVDYVETLPQWDGRNIFVQGNSQGGALSVVMAALDPRVDAIAIAHPALSDMAGYAKDGRTGGYPHFGQRYVGVALTPAVIETLAYYDVVNFARRVRCPVYMTWGYNDNVCPPTTSWIVWNVLTCPKEQYVTPINEHWISTETRYRQMRFLQAHIER